MFGDNLTQIFGDLLGKQQQPSEEQSKNMPSVVGLLVLCSSPIGPSTR